MARTLAAVLCTAVLAASTVLVASPAQARWSHVGGGTDFRICKTGVADGEAWRFRIRIGRRAGVAEARGAVTLVRGAHRRDRWRSGWLGDDVVRASLRVRQGPRVRVVVGEESGDRSSPIGTARQRTVLAPRRVRHC